MSVKYGFRENIQRGHLNMGGTSPSGERIEVNSRYIERNGKPWIGVMGEMHFSRCRREDWRTELAKMKAGGITIVSTYLFWIHHEEIEGEFDFSGNRDIRAFVETAGELGLEVVLRPGPWVHAECRNGGFPDWLMKKTFALRGTDPEYLAAVRCFFARIAEETRGLYFEEGGNIIGIQIENECVNNAEYLLALKKMMVELGMRVPLYTVTGWNAVGGARIPVDEVIPLFGGYCAMPWEQHRNPLPPGNNYFFTRTRNDTDIGNDLLPLQPQNEDGWRMPYERYPFATCELGGGIMVTHHRRPIIHGMDIYAMSLVKLGCGNNLPGYYMYHGGTNPIGRLSTMQESRETGYPNDLPILTYDFQAPVSEYGEIREQYRLLNMLHLFLQDFGSLLAPMEAADSEISVSREDTETLRCGLRADGNSGFVFVNHHQRNAVLRDLEDVRIAACGTELPPLNVSGQTAFFLPIGMPLGDVRLTWATAQPLCRDGNTFFFVEIPGIVPEYLAEGIRVRTEAGLDSRVNLSGAEIVTLTWEQARMLRRLDGRIVIGEDCDLYIVDGQIRAAENGPFTYRYWNGSRFLRVTVPGERAEFNVTRQKVDAPPFDSPYFSELRYGENRGVRWERISVDGPEGWVEIPDVCDVSQIYADGQLTADNFYYGKPWRVPARILYGKDCYLALSEFRREDAYWEC